MTESPMLTDEAVEEMRNLDWARSCSPVGPHEQSAEFSRMRAQAFLAAQDREALAEVALAAINAENYITADDPPALAARAVVDALLGDA